jgi:hypothetical protein
MSFLEDYRLNREHRQISGFSADAVEAWVPDEHFQIRY